MKQPQKEIPPYSLKIVVTGDVAMDWHLGYEKPAEIYEAQVQGNDEQSDTSRIGWERFGRATVHCQPGGAALLGDLIAEIVKELKKPNLKIFRVKVPGTPLPDDTEYTHSFVVWRYVRQNRNSEHRVWRAAESLGMTRSKPRKAKRKKDWRRVRSDPEDANVIVIDDADFGFRGIRDLWPRGLGRNENNPWVILKMTGSVARGQLWKKLVTEHSDRLIVILTVDDLRRGELQISRGISWERTAQDLLHELCSNSNLEDLQRCRHIVISFGTAGAMLVSRTKGEVNGQLFFDPLHMEDRWDSNREGSMYGYTVTLAAAITRQLMEEGGSQDVAQGIQIGVACMRDLFDKGYGLPLGFPHKRIGSQIAANARPKSPILSETRVEALQTGTPLWTILSETYGKKLSGIAQRIVREGLEAAVQGVPVGKFGRLITIDRREIESLESIQSLIREYAQTQANKPLSIAVFGPPGAGKSFGVSEVAETIRPGEIQKLTFNLSQLARSDDLFGPFHQVRDVNLSGKIPLVFWDEFDAALGGLRLGWLRYFLAPMQDGEFQQGEITHPIGRSIFVFAGGTSNRFDKFVSSSARAKSTSKATDFVSRLKGFLNVLGPNPQGNDPYAVIRRAILLRSLLAKHAQQLFEAPGRGKLRIDKGVLRAFLETSEFKHGARSIEAIILTSALSRRTRYERSSLPPADQLSLHVNPDEFLQLLGASQ